jgi:hypothetical protein
MQGMKIFSRITRMFRVRRQRVFYISDSQDIVPVNMKADFNISDVTLDNVHRVTDFRGQEHSVRSCKLLEEGQYGIYAWRDSNVVGHGWAKICMQRRCRVNGYFDIYQGEAFIHYCNVKGDQRGQNIYPAILAALCQHLLGQAKVKRVIIDTEIDNEASLRGISKVGFKLLGTGTFLQIGSRLLLKHFVRSSSMCSSKAQPELPV